MAVALNEDVKAHGLAIAELKALPPLVAGLQTTFASWVAAVIGVAAILLTGVAVLAAFQVFNGQGIKEQASTVNTQAVRLERVDATTQALSAKVDGMATDLAVLVDRQGPAKKK
jgi:hypothetical protein